MIGVCFIFRLIYRTCVQIQLSRTAMMRSGAWRSSPPLLARPRALLVLLTLALLTRPCAPLEWAGLFATPQDSYTWVAQAAGGEYAASGMKMVVMPADAATEAELLARKDAAERKFSQSPAEGGFGQCTRVAPGGAVAPTPDACYDLRFHKGTLDSTFSITTAGQAHVAIITSHLPTEFEDNEHYFKDAAGNDVDPLHSVEEEGGDDDGHGHGSSDDGSETLTLRIVAVFAAAGITLLGLGIFFTKQGKAIPAEALLCVRSGSAGAMISVAIVHILPEAGHSLESVTNYPLSAALVLGGVMLSFFLEVLPGSGGHDHVETAPVEPNAQTVPPQPVLQSSTPGFPPGLIHHAPGHPGVMMGAPMINNFAGGGIVMAHGASFGTDPSAMDVEAAKVDPDAIVSSRIAVETIEIGCVCHSIILGITLGMQTEHRTAAVLLAVFLLHQLLESICLSHLIAGLASRAEKLVMIGMTAGSMPLGIVIGIIILQTADGEHSPAPAQCGRAASPGAPRRLRLPRVAGGIGRITSDA